MPQRSVRPLPKPADAGDREWDDYLRANGLRATRAAVAVLKALNGTELPLSHEELEGLTAPIDRVTLYRVLDRLVAAGLVQRIASSGRVGRFVAVQAQANSYFECTSCHRVTPLPEDEALPGLLNHLRHLLEKQGLESTQTVFRVQGTCSACKAGSASAGG